MRLVTSDLVERIRASEHAVGFLAVPVVAHACCRGAGKRASSQSTCDGHLSRHGRSGSPRCSSCVTRHRYRQVEVRSASLTNHAEYEGISAKVWNRCDLKSSAVTRGTPSGHGCQRGRGKPGLVAQRRRPHIQGCMPHPLPQPWGGGQVSCSSAGVVADITLLSASQTFAQREGIRTLPSLRRNRSESRVLLASIRPRCRDG